MNIQLESFIPWLAIRNGTYQIEKELTVAEFLQSLNIAWDHHILVTVNQQIAKQEDRLVENDRIVLLVPITGG